MRPPQIAAGVRVGKAFNSRILQTQHRYAQLCLLGVIWCWLCLACQRDELVQLDVNAAHHPRVMQAIVVDNDALVGSGRHLLCCLDVFWRAIGIHFRNDVRFATTGTHVGR
jgi:hypothetical protein